MFILTNLFCFLGHNRQKPISFFVKNLLKGKIYHPEFEKNMLTFNKNVL